MTAMFLSIVKVVLVPIGAGVIINMLFKKAVSKVTPVLPLVSVTAIVLIVGGVVSANSEKILETGVLMMAVVILHNVLGYLVGYLVGKVLLLNLAKKKAISIEAGMQNSGLATSLAMAHFTPAAAIAGAMFSVWHNISGSLLANYFVTKTED